MYKFLILLFICQFITLEATCMKARLKAQSNGRIGMYVPRCNEENPELYKTLQCHGSTGLCWCVQETTGEQIENLAAFRLWEVGSEMDITTYCE